MTKRKIIMPDSEIVVPMAPFWDLSRKDWEKRIRKGESLMPDSVRRLSNKANADEARTMYGGLCLPDVPGTPLLSDVGAEWSFEIVEAIFGSWNGVARSVNEFFILVPKKNSKTTNAAAIMLTALILAQRPRAEFILVAPTQNVANLAFSQVVGMIENDKQLMKIFDIKDYIKKIIRRKTGSSLTIKSFDPKIVTGSKPVGVLIDELHVIAEHSTADRVLGQLRGGIIANPEGFMITITTQSEKIPQGVFKTELSKARRIRDGELNNVRMLPILYEFPPSLMKDDKWKDPKVWPMVTPNNGKSITVERLKEEYQKAVATSDEEIKRWASQHLNIQIGIALKDDAWAGATYWQESTIPLELEQLIERSEILTVGIDGGGLADMLAIGVCGRDRDTHEWLSWSRAWIHKKALDLYKQEAQRYKDFVKDGDLTIVETMGEDMVELGDIIEQVVKSDKLDKIGVDPSGLGMIIDELKSRGVDPEKQVVGIPQGWKLTGTIKTAERKLAEGKFKHADQPLTLWAVQNAKVEPRGNAVLITKQLSGSGKIDPLMATFNAIELMSRNPQSAEKQYQMMIIG